jgi:hypothetical protein
MTNKLKIIDYVMGTGKTRFILNKLATDVSKRFIYVAPILSEIESRAKDELAGVAVGVPSDKNSTKGADMLEMLEQGINVACTHSLLQSLTTKHIDLIKEWDYVLVIDEVVDFISAFNQYTKDSISDLFDDGKLIADEDNKGKISMNWDVREHNHFGALKNMCDTGMIYSSKRPSDMLNIQIPPSVLSAACEVYVLTYMYEASTMCKFMEIHNFTYEKMIYPELVQLERTIKQNIKALINIIDIRAVDTLFNRQKNTTFSQSWYVKVGKNKEVVQLENKAITIKMLDKIDNYLSNNTEKGRCDCTTKVQISEIKTKGE